MIYINRLQMLLDWVGALAQGLFPPRAYVLGRLKTSDYLGIKIGSQEILRSAALNLCECMVELSTRRTQ